MRTSLSTNILLLFICPFDPDLLQSLSIAKPALKDQMDYLDKVKDLCQVKCNDWPFKNCSQTGSSGSRSSCGAMVSPSGVLDTKSQHCRDKPKGCIIPCNQYCDKEMSERTKWKVIDILAARGSDGRKSDTTNSEEVESEELDSAWKERNGYGYKELDIPRTNKDKEDASESKELKVTKNCQWSEWSSCKGGKQKRILKCDGKSGSKMRSCHEKSSKTKNCEWSQWSSCKGGNQKRILKCNGKLESKTRSCSDTSPKTANCKWSDWSSCDNARQSKIYRCGGMTKEKSRSCDAGTNTTNCKWNKWTSCINSRQLKRYECGGVKKTKTRSCNAGF